MVGVENERPTDLFSFSTRKAKSFWIFMLLSAGVLAFLVYSTYLIIYDTISGNYGWIDIDKPNNDPKIYKYLPELLPNAPPIVVVQDPGAQLTGFAIGVSAGSYYDPMDFPGLAHFTEHMLFLGTEKYPGPTAFDEFISSHGGSSNAFTDSERTVYYNTIDSEAFTEGFSRFIEFFTRPTFNATYVAKEVNAVDSEHDMHINDPNWRMFSAISSLTLPPTNHYSTGDSSTLLGAGVDSLEAAVRTYFANNYCFNRLSIAIVSPLAVSDQVEIVRDVFSSISTPIPQNCRTATNFTRVSPELFEAGGLPVPVANRHKLIYSEGPTGTQPVLWLAFPFRAVATRNEAGKHPFGIIDTVLTHNGEFSLKRQLIASGLITSMSFLSDDTSAGSIAYIAFDVPSTAKDRVDELVATTFAFLEKMRANNGIPKVYMDKLQKVREALFYSNAESHSIVNEAPMRLAKYFASQLVTASRTRGDVEKMNAKAVNLISENERILEVDEKLVNELLGELVEDNAVIMFHDPGYDKTNPPDWVKEFSGNYSKQPEITDAHYGFKFVVSDISKPLADAMLVKNMVVVKDVTVMPPAIGKLVISGQPRSDAASVMKPPVKLVAEPGMEIWYKSSQLAKGLPKTWLWASVRPAAVAVSSISPEELQFNGEMLVDCVTFELRSRVADFILAGYDFVINWMYAGYFEVKVYGWENRISELMKIVVAELSAPKLTHFDLILAEKIDAMTRSRDLAELAGEAVNSLVVGAPTRDDIKNYLNTYSPSKSLLDAWNKAVFKSAYFSVYIAGSASSYTDTNATTLGRSFVESFGKKSVLADRKSAVFFSAGPRFSKPVQVRMVNPTADDPNSVLLYALTYGTDMSSKDRVVSGLLASILSPLIFRFIRTEHQMGYIASGKVGVYPGPAGSVQLRVFIQGNVADPDLMEARLEELFATVPNLLEKISLDEIQERAEGVSAGLEENPTSAHAEVSQFWQSVHDESECFDRAENQANYLHKTDPATLRSGLVNVFNAFWKDRRSKVAVKIFKSEGSDGTVAPWNKAGLAAALGENSAGLLETIAAEMSTTTVISTLTKTDREDVFKSALNPKDPLWEPVIAACEVA